jgi:ABC-type Fe3+ transport system permease subunit
MNLLEATACTALRAAVIAFVTSAIGVVLVGRVRRCSPAALRGILALAALAYFLPAMLAGYGWLPTVVKWPANSAQRELFYDALLMIRFAPIATLALWLAHAGPGAAAWHVGRLTGAIRWRWWLREAGSAPWLAAGIVFLLAFQEFDLATSWGIRSWTVTLFDSQIGGLALNESLRLALLPLGIELMVILPLLFALKRRKAGPLMEREMTRQPAWPLGVLFAIAPLALFLVLPSWFVLRLGFTGVGAWFESWTMAREIVHGCISAGVASLFAWALTSIVGSRAMAVLIIPGLLGSLLLSLVTLGAVQNLPDIGSTVFPWLLTLTLQLLPVAALLRLLMRLRTAPAAVHTARLASARSIEWTLVRYPAMGAVLLLFCLAYSDFTISALLAPPQFTTVFVRVFNLMHYGQSAVLSVTVLFAVLVPLLVLGLTHLLLRLYVRRCVR